MNKKANVVMYSPDSIGLGHVRRNSTIAREIVRQSPESSVVLLVGSGAGAFFSLPAGVDSIKLPSVQKIGSGTWKPRSLNLSNTTTTGLRASMVQGIVRTLQPDVFVVDHLPAGIWDELLPTLEMIRSRGLRTRVLLGLRDILDTPEVIRKRWQDDGVYETIERYYDEVLIYGDRDVVASADLYGLEGIAPGGAHYCGYVFDGGERLGKEDDPLRELPGLANLRPGERVIVACGGGGHDAYPMLASTLEALQAFQSDDGVRSVVISGPLMPADDRARLVEQAESMKRVTLLPWTSDCLAYLRRSDVNVIMAGYNSTLEALSSKARVVMMPRPGPSAEQRMRASMLAEQGHVTCIDPDHAGPEPVRAAIAEALQAPARRKAAGLLSGAQEAARRIIEQVANRASPSSGFVQEHEVSPYVLF